ncbi:hypothetical protein BBJ66_28135 [Rhizobium sp. RSm-3]|nr:hypothetical protein BBJ66_28135 [Rhizobium sp. RSm-3]
MNCNKDFENEQTENCPDALMSNGTAPCPGHMPGDEAKERKGVPIHRGGPETARPDLGNLKGKSLE